MLNRLTLLKISAFIAALFIGILIFPRAANAWFLNLANTRIARAVSLPQDAPDRATALAEAGLILSRQNWHRRAPLANARLLLARGEPQRAADALERSSAALQSDPIAQFIWGDAFWQSNQLVAAYTHWHAAGALEYFIRQAQRAADAHQWKDAENFARIAVGIDPAFAVGHYVLGDAWSHQERSSEALSELERARELTQDKELLAAIISRQGEILASQVADPATPSGSKWQDALDRFDRARAIAPVDARPRTGYALALLQLQPDAHEQAIALLTQVVDDSPWYIAAYVALADLSESRGDLDGAEQWLEKGLAKNPNDARLLFRLGEYYARQHRRADAKATLVLAMKYETHADELQKITKALAGLNAP